MGALQLTLLRNIGHPASIAFSSSQLAIYADILEPSGLALPLQLINYPAAIAILRHFFGHDTLPGSDLKAVLLLSSSLARLLEPFSGPLVSGVFTHFRFAFSFASAGESAQLTPRLIRSLRP